LGIFGNFETIAGAFVEDMYNPDKMPSVIAMRLVLWKSPFGQSVACKWVELLREDLGNVWPGSGVKTGSFGQKMAYKRVHLARRWHINRMVAP
jgi:hypothetical protein